MNSKKQGDIGVGAAIAYFTSFEYTVCIPLTDSQEYDLIVEKDGNTRRVQVKTSTFIKNQSYNIRLITYGGNRTSIGKIKPFDSTKFDFLFILTDDGATYLIPSNEIKSKYTIAINKSSKYLVKSKWGMTGTGDRSGL